MKKSFFFPLTAGSGNQNPLNTGYGSRPGPEAAIFAEFKFSRLFSLQPMIEYSSVYIDAGSFVVFLLSANSES
ncbi:MAG TPA: hypothetical protein VL727_25080 [Puia sp.]|nr:hypothetical protein [Puia sp.]